MILNGNKSKIRKYLRLYEIEVELYSNRYIQKQNLAAQEMHKRTKKENKNDERIYF